MNRFLAASTLGLISLMTLNAGQIQIGGPSGLTTTYVGGATGSTTSTSCTGASYIGDTGNAAWHGCISVAASSQGSTGTGLSGSGTSYLPNGVAWVPKQDNSGLFEKAGGGSGLGNPLTPLMVSGAPYNTFNLDTEVGGTVGSNPTVDGLSDFGNNSANVPQSGLYSLTIPVGVYGATSVNTMLQDFWASKTAGDLPGAPDGVGANGQSTAVTFEFNATDSSGATGTDIFDTVYLTNGTDIRNGVTCTGTSSGSCSTDYLSTLAASDSLRLCSTTNTANNTSNILNGCAPGSTLSETLTPNVYSLAFSGSNLSSTSAYANVNAGTVQLDEQTFSLSGLGVSSDFLVAIIINNQMYPNGAVGNSGGSKVAVSAITVNSPVSPEPSTIFLFLAGIGSIGLGKLRRRK